MKQWNNSIKTYAFIMIGLLVSTIVLYGMFLDVLARKMVGGATMSYKPFKPLTTLGPSLPHTLVKPPPEPNAAMASFKEAAGSKGENTKLEPQKRVSDLPHFGPKELKPVYTEIHKNKLSVSIDGFSSKINHNLLDLLKVTAVKFILF